VSEVSIVVPCYNEGEAIGAVLDRVRSYLDTLEPRVASEIVAVDDGSSDSTAAALQAFSVKYADGVRIVTHPANRGLTQAMRTGAAHATKRVVLFMDADLSYAPETIGDLLAAKEHAGAALAIASPYMAGGRVANVPFVRLAASRVANVLLSLTVGRRIRTFTGMVRAYDRHVFTALAERASLLRGEFNSVMVAEALRAGLGIVEVPAGLIWPPERTAGAARISARQLLERTRLVVTTVKLLLDSGKGWVKNARYGSLVLVQRPNGPYITLPS
jgi:glycosyltransferase involved in cell wall biosynthesis